MHERRRRRRFPLQCTVEFDRDGQTFLSGTLNISSQGFYCIVDKPVKPGEELHCLVDLMEGHAGLSLPGVSLNCDVLVLRSEDRGEGHGIACWIKKYTVVRASSWNRDGASRRTLIH
jgi:hypothetical protein